MPRKSESYKEIVDVIGCIAVDNEKRYRNDRPIDKTAVSEKIVDPGFALGQSEGNGVRRATTGYRRGFGNGLSRRGSDRLGDK